MENEIIDDLQSGITQNDTNTKQRGFVKTFGWISFGIAIFYFFSGLVSLVSSSMMNSFSKLSSSVSGNQFSLFEQIGSLQVMSAALTLIVAIIVIIGAVGYVTFKEWGRKLYLGGCLGAIIVNLLGIYISIYTMSIVSKMADTISGMSREEARMAENIFGSFGSFFAIIAIVFSLIPLTYLVINVFIAVNPKTKVLMK